MRKCDWNNYILCLVSFYIQHVLNGKCWSHLFRPLCISGFIASRAFWFFASILFHPLIFFAVDFSLSSLYFFSCFSNLINPAALRRSCAFILHLLMIISYNKPCRCSNTSHHSIGSNHESGRLKLTWKHAQLIEKIGFWPLNVYHQECRFALGKSNLNASW